jgi:4-amino-4-deoxy-L-arabinose transferase-like glycosyltransferase
VAPAVIALAVCLVLTIDRYGYHRDELYFRLLPPRWGYVDQPPLLPAMVRLTRTFIADEAWALRLPALILGCGSVVLLARVAQVLGGGARAQMITAWGVAFGTFTLTFSHVFLTASVDLVLWPAVLLTVITVIRTEQPRWWLLAGVLVGVGTYDKWLIVVLVIAVLVGIVAVGPRPILRTRWLAVAAMLAVIIGLPNVIWQATNGLPQLAMGAALSVQNAESVRISLAPLLLVMIGPLVCWIWIVGVVQLLRRSSWRPYRFLTVVLVVVVVQTFAGGSQVYYPYPVLTVVFAAGAVEVARWSEETGGRRAALVTVIVGLHVLSNALLSLPLLPVTSLRHTPIPAINQAVADQVGWPRYVSQIDVVVAEAQRSDPGTVVLAANYGEAGALDRFGSTGVPVYSVLNALWDLGPPPEQTATVVVVGLPVESARRHFERCTVRDRLDNGVGVDNEEQGAAVAICVNPQRPWAQLWPDLRQLG